MALSAVTWACLLLRPGRPRLALQPIEAKALDRRLNPSGRSMQQGPSLAAFAAGSAGQGHLPICMYAIRLLTNQPPHRRFNLAFRALGSNQGVIRVELIVASKIFKLKFTKTQLKITQEATLPIARNMIEILI